MADRHNAEDTYLPRYAADAPASARSRESVPRRHAGAAPAATPSAPSASDLLSSLERGAGRVRHDERGNAIWEWVKDTGRFCISSTSALLRRLEVPELKLEIEDERRVGSQASRDKGGGYDPYNQKTPVKPSKLPARK
jgi:hypothetical protein